MNVDVFIPTYVDQICPQTGLNMIKLLTSLGINVNYNPQQTTTGEEIFNTGDWEVAKIIGEKFVNDFNNNRPIISPSYAPVYFVKNYFDEMFYNSSLHNEYHNLKNNFFELSDFLINYLKIDNLDSNFYHKISFFDPKMVNKNSVISILNLVKGLKIIPNELNIENYFFENTLNLKYKFIYDKIAEDIVLYFVKNNVDYIVTTDFLIIEILNNTILRLNANINTIHLVDILTNNKL